jgi:hypothetical protein
VRGLGLRGVDGRIPEEGALAARAAERERPALEFGRQAVSLGLGDVDGHAADRVENALGMVSTQRSRLLR